VITSVRYAAQLDALDNPAKDANGRFIKTDKIVSYTVKEKRAGWGAEYPEEARNGEWEYRVFRADKTANPDTAAGLFQLGDDGLAAAPGACNTFPKSFRYRFHSSSRARPRRPASRWR
jgi:hypothetical protein